LKRRNSQFAELSGRRCEKLIATRFQRKGKGIGATENQGPIALI
jgi:hypothetical protein